MPTACRRGVVTRPSALCVCRTPSSLLELHLACTVCEHPLASGPSLYEQSLAPPSIVKFSNSWVVLSWRATVGQCSIRTEVSAGSTHSQDWANLEEDSSRHHGAKPSAGVSAVEVFDVDHVELQTCRGCPHCLHGEENGEKAEEGAGEHQYGAGCWRTVYQGLDCRCQVDLGQGNALHHFRLLVRTRLPPPEKRGYMRPKHASVMGFEASTDRAFENLGGGERGDGRPDGILSSNQTSPHTRRRRQRHRQQPGVVVASLSDSGEETHSAGIGGYSRKDGSDDNLSQGQGTRGLMQDGVPSTTARDGVHWFASDSVFVDSRPPPVTLHGIGTALVLTWPGVTGFSGAEGVSYILEQWSHAASPAISPASKAAEHGAAAVPDDGSAAHELDHPTRQRQRRRHHPHHLTPPKNIEAKEVFSVGRRCWFMPTGLKTGKRYWYRLRLIHERGKSVGGSWVSHLTSVVPPRCVGVGSRGLVLALPRAIDEAFSPARSEGARSKSSSSEEQLQTEQNAATMVGDTELLAAHELTRKEEGGETVRHADGVGGAASDSGKGDGGRARDAENREEEPDTPMVWYTLEGLSRSSGWIVLYRGPAPEVMVEVRERKANKGIAMGVAIVQTVRTFLRSEVW